MEYRGIPCCAPCGGHHKVCESAADVAFKLQDATANTATMIKDGAQAFRMPDGSLCVTREWISNNAHLLGGSGCCTHD